MSLEIRIALAPVQNDNGVGDSRLSIERQNLLPFTGEVNNEMASGVSLGLDRNLFSFEADEENLVENRLANGDVRTTIIGPPRRNVTIDLSCLSSEKMRVLDAMLATGRPLAIGAYYDESTQFMSHLAGRHPDLIGCAEVGTCHYSNIQRRDGASIAPNLDWTPSPLASDASAHLSNAADLTSLNRYLKVTKGMIGNGARFDSGERANLATNRFCTHISTTSLQMFPTVTGTASVRRISAAKAGSPIPAMTQNGVTGYIEHVVIGRGTGNYVQSNVQGFVTASAYHTVSILMRGTGRIKIGGRSAGVENQSTNVDLTSEWKWHVLRAWVPTTSASAYIRLGDGATNQAMFQVAAMQVELGESETSFMDYGTAPVVKKTDAVYLNENLNWSGFTVVVWVKFVYTDENHVVAVYRHENSGVKHGVVLQWRLGNMNFIDFNPGGSTYDIAIPNASSYDGQWVQMAFRWDATNVSTSGHIHRKSCFFNGTLLGESTGVTKNAPMVSTDDSLGELFLLGDDGLYYGSTVSSAINTVADSIRVDGRPWTDAEVLTDYENRSDVGMQHFLQKVQGRYFRPALAFGTWGPLIDLARGSLTLREVSRAPQSSGNGPLDVAYE